MHMQQNVNVLVIGKMTPKYYLFHLILRYKVLVAIIIVLLILLYTQLNKHFFILHPEYCGEPIDAVYTWVNGSDPRFLISLNALLNNNITNNIDSSPQRFDDKYELKFSLRSIEKYSPWIRHVYIVTNGQIPYWLNLDSDAITVVTHDEIFPYPSDLPSFSSPAIESHLHRIPGISKRFIYLNDDTFLGDVVYPEDFVSPSRGYLMYLTWQLPPCSIDCPWMYVNDGQCDAECYNEACQMDGTDCDKEEKDSKGRLILNQINPLLMETEREINATTIEPPSQSNTKLVNPGFAELFKSTDGNISHLINEHNRRVIQGNKTRRKKLKYRRKTNSSLIERVRRIRRNIDAYGESLQYTNRLLNANYGFMVREVAAHAPIMIDVEVMKEMQIKFNREVRKTSRHRLRSVEDLQFSFMYYHYLMEERIEMDVGQIFDHFDTDRSGTWSDREIRTILTKLYELPLSYSTVDHFEFILTNCTATHDAPEVSTPEFERYIDSKLPTISKFIVMNCPTLKNILVENFGSKSRYKWTIIHKSHNTDVIFKMLNSNISDVVGHLDEIRRKPSKFICLNDNLEIGRKEDNDQIKSVLYDFYLSLFPLASKYELPTDLRNRFLHMDELRAWKRFHYQLKYVLLVIFLGFLYICTFRLYTRRVMGVLCNKLF